MIAFLRRLAKPALLKVFPQSVLSTLACEWHLYLIRRMLPALRRRYAGQKNLLVNFGAGGGGREGWVNVDGFQQPGVNCLLDGRGPMPFEDGSVRGFYTEHFFEHLPYPDSALTFLRECHRVMESGATLRLIVPDGGAYLHAYCQEGWEALSITRPLDGLRNDPYGRSYNTKMELINEVFRQGEEHKFAYDYETLAELFKKAGFENVRRGKFGESSQPELLLDFPRRASESLYVEAVR